MKTPEEWENEMGVVVLDPDGWRRDGKSWHEPLTRDDFWHRMVQSTVIGMIGLD